MMRQQMVQDPKTGVWSLQYVDQGPKAALPGHGVGLRRGAVGPLGLVSGTHSTAKQLG